ncbi:Ger(x)C family spore germination protein [Effusibacillus consociatus]|uniref:Ger(X)C family spore germination protein n=1 Tax=Effusibacillus consociatus TaxID=1117041 RepID=A0ABV9Q6H5_9BACL
MSRLVKILITVLMIVFSVTGCWDRRELEQRTSVVAFAVDVNEDNPELIDVTIQIPIPIKIVGAGGGGGGQGGKEAVRVISGSGRTVLDAMQNIEKRLNQQLFYGHTRIVVLSDKIAKTDIADFMDILRRSPQVRRLLWPIIVPGRASKILDVDPKLEQIPMMFIKEMLETGARDKVMPDISLGEFFISLSDTSVQPMMNLVSITNNGMRWSGTAVFKESKMVGQLTEPHVWAYMNLRDKKPGGEVVVPCFDQSNRFMAFHPRDVATKVRIEHRGGQIHATYDVRMEGDIVESECKIDFNNEAVINKVQEATAKVLENRANEMIRHVQKDLQTDVLGLGFLVRARHPELWRTIQWDQEFPNVKIDVIYKVNMRRFGMSMGKE